MKKIIALIFVFVIAMEMNAQNQTDREYIISQTNVERLMELSNEFAEAQRKFGKPLKEKIIDQRGVEHYFSHFDAQGKPVYFSLENETAAQASSIDHIRIGGDSGLDLDGSGVVFAIWEGSNPRVTHQEFDGRINLIDTTVINHHATHVSGILIATGIQAQAGGMAPLANIDAFTTMGWANEIPVWAANGGMINNHSYTLGNPGADYVQYGVYDDISKLWDDYSYNAPYLIMCTGASNNGSQGYNPDNSRFDLLPRNKLGKNSIVIGACNEVWDYTGPSSVSQASFTSWGPTDDWRIKPDISAVGVNSYSTREDSDTDYGTGQGSSYASPVVAGGLGLLQQHYHNLNGIYMKAATAKGLILSTTDEAGAHDGPDFSNGWGLFNAQKAAKVISNDGTTAMISELSLLQNESYSIDITTDGTQPLTVAISWTDPSAEPTNSGIHNDPTPMLVNDLDLRVLSQSTEYFPWMMEPNAAFDNYNTPATKGDNYRDNIEVIFEENIEAGVHTVQISHKGDLLFGSQDFSLIINGIVLEPTSVSEINLLNSEIVVYPNPIDDVLKIDIQSPPSKLLKIDVLDLTGRTQLHAQYPYNNTLELEVSTLSSGIYFLNIRNEENALIGVEKIVIN